VMIVETLRKAVLPNRQPFLFRAAEGEEGANTPVAAFYPPTRSMLQHSGALYRASEEAYTTQRSPPYKSTY